MRVKRSCFLFFRVVLCTHRSNDFHYFSLSPKTSPIVYHLLFFVLNFFDSVIKYIINKKYLCATKASTIIYIILSLFLIYIRSKLDIIIICNEAKSVSLYFIIWETAKILDDLCVLLYLYFYCSKLLYL